jgi:hypothetical protein
VNCRCLYIGGPTEYVKYHRLATERDMTEGELKGNAFLASCPEASMNLRR